MQWFWNALDAIHWWSAIVGLLVGYLISREMNWASFILMKKPHENEIKANRLMFILDFADEQAKHINLPDRPREAEKRDPTGWDWAALYNKVDPTWRDFR